MHLLQKFREEKKKEKKEVFVNTILKVKFSTQK
jgi:hypothetical protein